MKNIRLLLFAVNIVSVGSLVAAPRPYTSQKNTEAKFIYVPVPINTQTTRVTQAEYDAMDPIERDKVMDNQLFAHFMSILGNFGKVVLNPHDKENVTTNVAQMIDGIVAVAHTVTKTTRSRQKFRNLVRLFMQHYRYKQYMQAQQKMALQQKQCTQS